MNKWKVERYGVKNINFMHEVEYWNFFLDQWVPENEVNDDCCTVHSAAHEFVSGNPGEIVKMEITIKEVQ